MACTAALRTPASGSWRLSKDHRNGAIQVPLPRQSDEDLTILAGSCGEPGQEVGVHAIAGEPREGSERGLGQFGVGIGGSVEQDGQAGRVA